MPLAGSFRGGSARVSRRAIAGRQVPPVLGGKLRVSDESLDVRWVPAELDDLPICITRSN
ncbi:hypothetical protein GCM10010402_44510 [Actinomadura luteofluorescens]